MLENAAKCETFLKWKKMNFIKNRKCQKVIENVRKC